MNDSTNEKTDPLIKIICVSRYSEEASQKSLSEYAQGIQDAMNELHGLGYSVEKEFISGGGECLLIGRTGFTAVYPLPIAGLTPAALTGFNITAKDGRVAVVDEDGFPTDRLSPDTIELLKLATRGIKGPSVVVDDMRKVLVVPLRRTLLVDRQRIIEECGRERVEHNKTCTDTNCLQKEVFNAFVSILQEYTTLNVQ